MILFTHIIIASASVIYTIYLFFRPSFFGLKISYTLIAATVISGTFLALTKPVHITQTCVTGLVYIAVVLMGTALARNRLTKQASLNK